MCLLACQSVDRGAVCGVWRVGVLVRHSVNTHRTGFSLLCLLIVLYYCTRSIKEYKKYDVIVTGWNLPVAEG